MSRTAGAAAPASRLQVQVVPRSSVTAITGIHNGRLKIKLTSAPVDGAANRQLQALLARELDVARSAIRITSGHTGRYKEVELSGSATIPVAWRPALTQKNP